MSENNILSQVRQILLSLQGEVLPIIDLGPPPNLAYAQYLLKILSKLSPLVGNLIEYTLVNRLNQSQIWPGGQSWQRQDPGFPDAIFVDSQGKSYGLEIKTWFPLATEMTARFRDSRQLLNDPIDVIIVAWIPQFVIFGQPQIIGLWSESATQLAEIRDQHYHRPPHYLVIEPEDTSQRSANLQQTNVSGYRFQEDDKRLGLALAEAESLGLMRENYSSTSDYQHKLHTLMARYRYRLDTNFAKLDRIQHPSLEHFKQEVLKQVWHGKMISDWATGHGLKTEEEFRVLLHLAGLP
jgi:hypothetical protein